MVLFWKKLRLIHSATLSILSQGTSSLSLMDYISLEHAAPKVISSDLIARYAIIIHFVEPNI